MAYLGAVNGDEKDITVDRHEYLFIAGMNQLGAEVQSVRVWAHAPDPPPVSAMHAFVGHYDFPAMAGGLSPPQLRHLDFSDCGPPTTAPLFTIVCAWVEAYFNQESPEFDLKKLDFSHLHDLTPIFHTAPHRTQLRHLPNVNSRRL